MSKRLKSNFMDLEESVKQYKKVITWKCNNGREIALTDMSDNHIRNCIDMINNNNSRNRAKTEQLFLGYLWISRFNMELLRRKE